MLVYGGQLIDYPLAEDSVLVLKNTFATVLLMLGSFFYHGPLFTTIEVYMIKLVDKSLLTPFAMCLLIIPLAIWASSGTLAPYAATHSGALALSPCNYLANLDHPHFLGPVHFLNGAPAELWKDNIMLRRILHPILSLPFFWAFGFEFGGFLANIAIHVAAIWLFLSFIKKRDGRRSALAVGLLLCSYPGITYWAGLPYSYAIIVPCCLIGFIFLSNFYNAETFSSALKNALGIGVLSLGYDLSPLYSVSVVLLVISKKRIGALLPALTLIIGPSLGMVGVLYYLFSVDVQNSNSRIYGALISSYLHPQSLALWITELLKVPHILFHNFFYSNFIFLPALFLLTLLLLRRKKIECLSPPELCFGFAILALFFFNNAAPPYVNKWQLRGEWVARIYQPAFVVYLSCISRCIAAYQIVPKERILLFSLVFTTFLCNSVIVFGPVFGVTTLAAHTYHNFYQHDREGAFADNLAKYGRRPFGSCMR